MRKLTAVLAGSVLAFSVAGAANAAFPVYPTPGTENPVTYSFSAAVGGDIVAYFAGQDAGDTEDLGLLIDGVDTGIYGLSNHSTAVGTALNFGHVDAGQSLTFFIRDGGNKWYSDKSLNSDGFNHIWITPYAGGDAGVPAGIFAAFEDLPHGGDKDYNDETFVFANIARGGVPEPATWSLMILGIGTAGAMLRQARKLAIA